jgi:hypothetical protein
MTVRKGMAMSDDVSIDVSLQDENPAAIRKMLQEAGAQQITEASVRGLTGVEECLFAIMGVQALANLVIRLLPLLKSGVIVDARGSKMTIRKDNRLPPGSVTTITKAGAKSTVHQPAEVALSNLLQHK